MFPGGYHYAEESASTGNYGDHCSPLAPYFGWGGVEATISPPSQPISVTSGGHVAAYIGFSFPNNGWVQAGWGQGALGCGSQSWDKSHPELYFEAATPANVPPNNYPANCIGNDGSAWWYGCWDLGPMPTSAVDFTIQYDGTHDLWVLRDTLGHSRSLLGSYWGNSGAAAVAFETQLTDRTVVSRVDFNYIVLRSFKGWMAWTPANMGSWGTQTEDERYNVNPCVLESNYVNYSHFYADQAPSGCNS
jgi:hypothetical protein